MVKWLNVFVASVSTDKSAYDFASLTSDVVLSSDASGAPKLFVRQTGNVCNYEIFSFS